jgi:hypothetical protein
MSDYSVKDHIAYKMGFKAGQESQAARIAELEAALQKRCEEAERTAIQAAECHARETRRADALQKRVAKLEEALATARREGMEYAKTLVDLYAKAALKCKQCGDICHDYYPDNCTGRTQYRESEEYKRRLIYDGEYSAMRYFEKHLCRPEMMDAEDAFKALAAAIRAALEGGKKDE